MTLERILIGIFIIIGILMIIFAILGRMLFGLLLPITVGLVILGIAIIIITIVIAFIII